jgi:DNA-binding NarL/FixJ family response regulator
MHDESLYAERALRAGARGYIMKQEASNKILDGIRGVLKGETIVSPTIKERLLRQILRTEAPAAHSYLEELSDRELEVFRLIGDGVSTSQIAQRLCLSVKTIETYREKLKQKLNLSSGAELLQHAITVSKTNSAFR